MASADLTIVFCGSFNPIHYGHLYALEAARDHAVASMGVSNVRGILSPVNDKYNKPDLSHSSHRLAMCTAAVRGSNWITVDSWEAEQEEYQRTLFVLQHVREATGIENVKLLVGADVLKSMATPGVWIEDQLEVLLRDFGLLVMERPDGEGESAASYLSGSDVVSRNKDNIHIIQASASPSISSTAIRASLRSGHSVRYLTPDAVVDYALGVGVYAAAEGPAEGATAGVVEGESTSNDVGGDSIGPAFCVVYRWTTSGEDDEDFLRAWALMTESIKAERGGLGSRIHRTDDGSWVAYAQWPSRQAWEDNRANPVSANPTARETMFKYIVESQDPIPCDTVMDLLELFSSKARL